MKVNAMRVLMGSGIICILLAGLGCMHLDSAREGGEREREKKAGGKIICMDEDL